MSAPMPDHVTMELAISVEIERRADGWYTRILLVDDASEWDGPFSYNGSALAYSTKRLIDFVKGEQL